MASRRFDKQLRFAFTALSALTLVVGLLSMGINRYLINSHDTLLSDTMPTLRLAERVGADADLAWIMADRLRAAESRAEIEDAARRMSELIGDIEDGIDELRPGLPDRQPTASAASSADYVDSMRSIAIEGAEIRAGLQAAQQRIEAAAPRLAAILAAQTDLARLRITAGVSELYTAAPDATGPGLDRLADRDFFAFERIGELSEAIAELGRNLRRAAVAAQAEELEELRAAIRADLARARARLLFLPSPMAARSVADEIGIYEAALAAQGILPLRGRLLEAERALAAASAALNGELHMLVSEAGRLRDASSEATLARIADAAQLAFRLGAGLAAATLLAVLAGSLIWLYARQRIVGRLGDVAERIVLVAQGEFGEPVAVTGHDEIGRLEASLNLLRQGAQEAADLRRSLEQAVKARTADVIQEMRASDEARAEAEAANRAKTHFLARMSHEIRTPLNGVIGMLRLLEAEENDPTRRKRLRTALVSADDLRELTNDILVFSSGEEGTRGGSAVSFDPRRLVEQLGDHLHTLAAEKGLQTEARVAPTLPAALCGDVLRIRQVLGNLISNAVKYTDKGFVTLRADHHRGAAAGQHVVSFSVSDTGVGMTWQETQRAFDVYGRAGEALRKGVEGTGLGLAVARQLTDAMGGGLTVESEPGVGSRFTLSLSLAEGDAVAIAADETLPAGVAVGRRVLVIDDHPVNRLVARGYLERFGAAVTEAATGAEAMAKADEGRFDLILIDLHLPDMHGRELAARIPRKGARTVVLTADLVSDDPATRARLGVDHVLMKPLSPRELANVLAGQAALPPAPEQGPEDRLRDDVADFGTETVSAILGAYLDDLPAALARIADAGTAQERSRAAHRLKGASSNFGLSELCDLLRRVEAGEAAPLGELRDAAESADAALRAAAASAGLQSPSAPVKQ